MSEVAITEGVLREAGEPKGTLFSIVGLTVALGSAYGALVGCSTCQESSTGMPAGISRALYILGTAFGLILFFDSSPGRPLSPRSQTTCASLILLGLALGELLLLGVVGGLYRYCPVCSMVWMAMALGGLGVVAMGGKEGRRMTNAIVVLILAAAWVRFDRTTAQGLAALFPRVNLSSSCVADVLTRNDLGALVGLGAPDDVPLFFVAHCSPCASATVKQMVAKFPNSRVVAADETLLSLVGRNRLIVYPPLAKRTASLGANIHRAKLHAGRITECKSNISSTD